MTDRVDLLNIDDFVMDPIGYTLDCGVKEHRLALSLGLSDEEVVWHRRKASAGLPHRDFLQVLENAPKLIDAALAYALTDSLYQQEEDREKGVGPRSIESLYGSTPRQTYERSKRRT